MLWTGDSGRELTRGPCSGRLRVQPTELRGSPCSSVPCFSLPSFPPLFFLVLPRPGYPFNKHSEAIAACAGIGARLATRAELDYAFYQNADWCACGAVSDGSWSYPIQTPRNGLKVFSAIYF